MDPYLTFAQALQRSHGARRDVRFGQGWINHKSPYMLGQYMDEVDQQVIALDAHMRNLEHNPSPTDRCSQGLFGAWNQFVNAPEASRTDTGQPYGWRAYYADNRGLLTLIFTDDPLWADTEAFEDELIRFWDWAAECGGPPPVDRPERKHQPPPPSETPEGQIKSAVKAVIVVAAIWGVAQVLQALPKGNSQ